MSRSFGSTQQLLHPGKALAARFLRRARASPVRLKRDGAAVAVLLERAELSGPVDDAATHRGPFPLAVRPAHGVLAVHVSDAALRQPRVAVGVGDLVALGRVARIPV